MKENKQKKLQERLEELYRIQDARLECNADDLDIREEIAEVEEEIKELQDNANVDRKNSIEEDINRCNKLTETINANWIGISNQLAIEHILSDYKRVLKENEEKSKIIDLMSKEILKLDIKRAGFIYDHPRIWETEKGIKQYFENKAKEVK